MTTVLLTPKTAISWIDAGVPTYEEIKQRHGLGDSFDIFTDRVIPQVPEDDDTVGEQVMTMMKLPRLGGFGIQFAARDALINACTFAIPCREAVDAIASGGPVLECGAGTGFWAALIRRHGGDVVATDDFSGHYGQPFGRYHPVESATAEEAVQRHQDRHLLMVWPTLGSDWAFKAAKALAPGRMLYLIGEGGGGCVGDDSLFEYLEQNFEEVGDIAIPQWPGIHDRVSIFRKNVV